jgi:hypothetical protein
MLKKHLFTISLLLPLVAISATAHAGSTITDKSYWPSEARRSAQINAGGSQSEMSSAFAFDRGASRLQPATNAHDGGWHYQGGPKSHWRQQIVHGIIPVAYAWITVRTFQSVPCPYLVKAQATWDSDATRIRSHLPAMRLSVHRTDADQCLSVLLCLQRLRTKAQAIGGRLLRVLFVRVGTLPAGPGRREKSLLPVIGDSSRGFPDRRIFLDLKPWKSA